jgi:hypothetical protein
MGSLGRVTNSKKRHVHFGSWRYGAWEGVVEGQLGGGMKVEINTIHGPKKSHPHHD